MCVSTHSICAMKSNNTPHDVAELRLVTPQHYQKLSGMLVPLKARADAENVVFFLKEHLPVETLEALKQIL